MFGSCNITLVTRKKFELVEETKRLCFDILASCRQSVVHGSNSVELGNGWKIFYTGQGITSVLKNMSVYLPSKSWETIQK